MAPGSTVQLLTGNLQPPMVADTPLHVRNPPGSGLFGKAVDIILSQSGTGGLPKRQSHADAE